MSKALKIEKQLANVISNNAKIIRIANGENEDVVTPTSAWATLGEMGGQARARTLTPEPRAEIAEKDAEDSRGAHKSGSLRLC